MCDHSILAPNLGRVSIRRKALALNTPNERYRDVTPIEISVWNHLVGLLALISMKPIAGIFGPLPPGASPLSGSAILAIALVGLLYIPVVHSRSDSKNELL
jgi:hypothetical protein